MKTRVVRRSGKASKRKRVTNDRKELNGDAFPIVGVGASAGGLEAFRQLLEALPPNTGMGFVLVQHLDPDHESQLTQILSRVTALPVREITNDEPVKPDRVYVIPRDTNLVITGGVLQIQPRQRARAPHRPIDTFFESLAEDRSERAVGVVLSGTATDGTLGLEAIKAAGGITFAQDDSAKQDSMPRSAVAAGCVDLVLSPAEIAKELARIAKHPYVKGRPLLPVDGDGSRDQDRPSGSAGPRKRALPSRAKETARAGATHAQGEELRANEPAPGKDEQGGHRRILSLLRSHVGVDFSLYKSTTVQRRIMRRMVLNKHGTLETYANFLRGNSKELDALFSDVLIGVTSFFRNPETFDVLSRKVLPDLLRQPTDEPIRCWVLGCSTGQEAYSIAMVFAEALEKAPRARKLQIFATDLNETQLERARHGLYAKNLVEDVSPQRLRRFFIEEVGGYRITKSLREMVVFARQNLLADPPFSRMDLISCRNLLIYLDSSVQKKAIPAFHYALKPKGTLLLGVSESIGTFIDLFEPIDKKFKVYSRKPAPVSVLHMPLGKERGGELDDQREQRSTRHTAQAGMTELSPETNAQREADRITVQRFAPPAVLVNADLQVLQFRGTTSAFLQPPVGKASFDLLKMAREGLMLPLRSVINQAKKENRSARKENVRVKRNGRIRRMNLEVIPLKNLRERCYLVLFEDSKEVAGSRDLPEPRRARERSSLAREAPRRVGELETELSELREYLQSVQEQHEAANEELQSANEEVQSANEELQSINEELETSKEELESANEELTTVNEEMSNRNVELSRLNGDLVNLEVSTKLAIVLFGRDLTIRHFSLQAERLFDLSAADVGRPAGHIRHGLHEVEPNRSGDARRWARANTGHNRPLDLEGLVAEVVSEVREQEREVIDKDGCWRALRVRPYMTLDNKVDGSVLVLVDIDKLKRSELTVAAARDYAEAAFDAVREPLLVLDGALRIKSANRSFYRAFGTTPLQTVAKTIYEIDNQSWDVPALHAALEKIAPENPSIDDVLVEHRSESRGTRTMLLNARLMPDPERDEPRILVAIEDVSERKRLEGSLRQYGQDLLEADHRKDEFLAMLGHELRNPLSALSHGIELLGIQGDDRARREELRAIMIRQTKRVGTILDQLLDIARLASGKVELSKHRLDVADAVRDAIETTRPLVERRHHELTLTLPREETAVVLGDEVRLAQVVENLLTNAAKYTNEGGQISVALEIDGENARVIVRDTGAGISAEFLPHVFELFTQSPRTLERASGGLGLGLPLVRRLVEMHGGDVQASSAGLGQGSEFVVVLPRIRDGSSEDRSEKKSAPFASVGVRRRRILVVDDEEGSAAMLAELLEAEGHETLAVNDGPPALEAARTFKPEIVLLDLGLPHMDGYEVAKKLREEHRGKKMLLIALTGYRSDDARLKEAGFDRHVLKPPNIRKLSAELAAWSDGG